MPKHFHIFRVFVSLIHSTLYSYRTQQNHTTNYKQCSEGHVICGDCVGKVDRCPICRCANISARNRALEQLASSLTVNCCYQESGCRLTGKLNEISTHEKTCPFLPVQCPWEFCDHQATAAEMIRHLKQTHNAVTGTIYRMKVCNSTECAVYPPFITEYYGRTIVTKVAIHGPEPGPNLLP